MDKIKDLRTAEELIKFGLDNNLIINVKRDGETYLYQPFCSPFVNTLNNSKESVRENKKVFIRIIKLQKAFGVMMAINNI